MDQIPAADLATHKKKKKKKKKRREVERNCEWIKVEPETEWEDGEMKNEQFLTSDKDTNQDVPKKKKKKKKKNLEKNFKTEYSGEYYDNGESEAIFDSNGLGLHEDDHLQEAKHVPKKKKKKKRKRRHSGLEEAVSQVMPSGMIENEEGTNATENAEDGESDSPLPPQAELHHHKQKKKKKKHRLPEQLPPETTIADEELVPTVLDSVKETSHDEIRDKRKRKAKGRLNGSLDKQSEDVIANNDNSGEQTSQRISDAEKRRKKRKRKAQDSLNNLCHEASQDETRDDMSHEEQTHRIEGHNIPKKKKKKKKHLYEAIGTNEPNELQDPCSNTDRKENCDPGATPKTKRRKETLKESGTGDGSSSVDSVHTTQKHAVTSESHHSNGPSKSKHKQKKRLDTAVQGSSSSSHSSPNDGHSASSPSKNQILSSSSHRAHTNEKSSSPGKIQSTSEGQHEGSKDPSSGGAQGLTFEGRTWLFDDIDEENDEELKDLNCHIPVNKNLQLAELKEGVVRKKGRWSGLEDNILRQNVGNFCEKYGIEDKRKVVLPYLYEDYKNILAFLRATMFNFKISKGLQRRPFDCYLRARKIFDYRNYKGRYTKEEIAKIHKLKRKYGNKWSQIGRRMDRSGQSVLDHYRLIKEGRVYGKWTEMEKEQLRQAVKMVADADGRDSLDRLEGIAWREVHKMVPTRNLRQCMDEWKHVVCWSVGNRNKHVWQIADAISLIESIYRLNVNEESDIDWGELHKEFWERASCPSSLVGKWHILKLRYLKNPHFMTFEDILDEMYQKALPILRERFQRREARIKSREFVTESDKDSDSDDDEDDDDDDEWN